MPGHRLQIRLDERRYEKVAREALRTGRSMAAVIRKAIDQLPETRDGRQAAVDAILAAEPMPVPIDPADLRRELDSAWIDWESKHGGAATDDRMRAAVSEADAEPGPSIPHERVAAWLRSWGTDAELPPPSNDP